MEVDVGPAVEHIYEVIDVSCACSVGLSRLVWKADIIVLKKKEGGGRQRRKTRSHGGICASADPWICGLKKVHQILIFQHGKDTAWRNK